MIAVWFTSSSQSYTHVHPPLNNRLNAPRALPSLVMSSVSTSGASSADLVLIGRVRDAMEVYGMNQIDVMRDSGVSNSVLCLWLQNKYKGDNAKVNDRCKKGIKNTVHPTP